LREEEKESLALEAAAAAAAVAEGKIREEAVVLKAAMVVGAGVGGDGDSVRPSDSRSAIWNGMGLIPLFILSFCFGLNLDGPISI